jgi:hypothetical protein
MFLHVKQFGEDIRTNPSITDAAATDRIVPAAKEPRAAVLNAGTDEIPGQRQ